MRKVELEKENEQLWSTISAYNRLLAQISAEADRRPHSEVTKAIKGVVKAAVILIPEVSARLERLKEEFNGTYSRQKQKGA